MSQAASHSIPAPAEKSTWTRWIPYFLFSLLWIDLLRQLSYTWETREQYSYGWFVPLFGFYLFWRRWTDRPDPRPKPSPLWLLIPIWGMAAFLLPLRVIFEINADWPLISWMYTGIVVCLSLYAVYLAGGWPWVRHFAFPIAFIFVAVAWPYRIENPLTNYLMHVVADITVEVLGILGVPALQKGNLIEISTGVLGIDEACSGIRSMQSAVMAGLLMGELYRLRILPRLSLFASGLGLAFIFNVTRTFIFSWQANKQGVEIIEKWHDPAGLWITVACFLSLWLLAVLIQNKWSHSVPLAPATPSPTNGFASLHAPSSKLRVYLLAAGCWSIFSVGATEAWYRSHALHFAETTRWWVNYPTNLPSFKPVTASTAAAELLKHDMERGGSWIETDGTKWTVFCFRWNEGDPTARMSAQAHRPEYCLVGSGHELIEMSGVQYLTANGIALPFRFYTFDSPEQPTYVFFSLWEDGAETQVGFGKSKLGDRLRSAWAGRRGMGQQTLEIICSGYPDLVAAEKAVRQRLSELIQL